jgi:hypothetical protein
LNLGRSHPLVLLNDPKCVISITHWLRMYVGCVWCVLCTNCEHSAANNTVLVLSRHLNKEYSIIFCLLFTIPRQVKTKYPLQPEILIWCWSDALFFFFHCFLFNYGYIRSTGVKKNNRTLRSLIYYYWFVSD